MFLVAKYCSIVFSQSTKLVVVILQTQVSQPHFVYFFFSHLRTYRNVDESSFLGDFLFIGVLSSTEPLLVEVNDNKFTSQPVVDLLFRLAHTFECDIVTLFEEEHEGPSRWGVVVSLHSDFVHIKTLQLLAVIGQVTNWVWVRLEKLAVWVRFIFDVQLCVGARPRR